MDKEYPIHCSLCVYKKEAGYAVHVVLEEDLLDLATTFVAKSFSKVFIVDKTMVVH